MGGHPTVGGYIIITWAVVALFVFLFCVAGASDRVSGRYYMIVLAAGVFIGMASTVALIVSA